MSRVPPRLANKVRERAGHRCEYCRLPARAFDHPLEVEHIIPLKHAGGTIFENLALACKRCNLHKGSNLGGMNDSGRFLVRLFNPRSDIWGRHFRFNNGLIIGRTEIGRATTRVLAMNSNDQVELRQLWSLLESLF